MASSGYVQVKPKQRKGGITRPGAVHLSLPLVERHSRAYDGSEENLLLVSANSSHWTISAVPKTSASLYSQASYTLSPRVFLEDKVDRRRFAIAKTPAQEGPWSRPVHSPISDTFVLDLKSATLSANPFIVSDEDSESDDQLEDLKTAEKEVLVEEVGKSETKRPQTLVPEVVTDTSENATQVRLKKLRMSTRVLGKMLSRLSIHQSSARGTQIDDETPLVPTLPPQILISLPSPGLKMPSTLKEDCAVEDLRAFVLDKNTTSVPKRSLGRPSTWKPRRPPSPMPKSLRGHGKHKGEGSAFLGFVVTSPPPPLPTRRQISSTVRLGVPAHEVPAASLGSVKDSDSENTDTVVSPRLLDIQKQLKARAK